MALPSLAALFPPRQTPLERQLAQLRRQLASVTGAAGSGLAHGAADLGDQFLQQGGRAAREVGRQAVRAGSSIRHDPVPAVVAVLSLALLIRLFAGNSERK